MTKHTPGPWAFRDGEIVNDDFDTPIATVATADDFPCLETDEDVADINTECDANGRLIAAAPDLLLACELVRGWVEHAKPAMGPVVWYELLRAIAKAKGDGNAS